MIKFTLLLPLTTNQCDHQMVSYTLPVEVLGSTSLQTDLAVDRQARIYPNLLRKEHQEIILELKQPKSQNLTIKIYNSYGQLINSKSLTTMASQKQYSLLPPQSPGIYFLQIQFAEGSDLSFKFIRF